jgi:peptidoglycan hydrolase FlgJ
MSFTSLDPTGLNHTSPLSGASARDAQAVRRAATEFEALLLSQLTAALNPAEDDEEESLFSNSSTGMYRQMFSEQVATAMARSGGVGLADTVLHQLDRNAASGGAHGARRAVEIAREVRGGGAETNLLSTPAAETAAPTSKPATELRPPPALPATARSFGTAVPRLDLSAAHPLTEPTTPRAARLPVNALTTATSVGVIAPAAGRAAATPVAARPVVELEIPLNGRISSRFGERRDPIHGRHRHHAGVDIAAARGTPIPAAAAGTVVFAGRSGGYGNLVEIEHADGRRTRYAHTDRILVALGEQVQDGQTIATVGSTGRSTGPHLHFEVRENGTQVDPLQAIAKDPPHSRR